MVRSSYKLVLGLNEGQGIQIWYWFCELRHNSSIMHGGTNSQIKVKIGTETNLGSRNPITVLGLRIDYKLINYAWEKD